MTEDRGQNSPDVRLLKSELRRRMEARRAEFHAQNKNAPFALRDHFLKAIKLPPGSIVAGYQARGNEIDPMPLIDALRIAGHVIALPVMTGKGEPLVFRIYNPGAPLVPNALGIPEPGVTASAIEPDTLLVPIVAFDRQHNRLGMGGGYYDRTIRGLRARKRILAIGIGFSCQEVPQIPAGPHDATLDRVATEIQVF